MEILLLVLPGFIFWWFLKEGDETGGVLKVSHWYFALPFAAFGFVFFSINSLLLGLLRCIIAHKDYIGSVEWVLTTKAPYLGAFMLTCINGWVLGHLASKRINELGSQAASGAGEDNWFHWLRLLRLFMPETKDNYFWLRSTLERYKVIIVSTKNNKAYYGVPRRITKSFAGEEGFLELNPIASGYRNSEQEITVTSDYAEKVEKEIKETQKSFSIVIPIREIVSVIQYDADSFSYRTLLKVKKTEDPTG
jgi:hypothetical protein